jgi:hypothetical protein
LPSVPLNHEGSDRTCITIGVYWSFVASQAAGGATAPSVVASDAVATRSAVTIRAQSPFGNCFGYRYEAMPMKVHSALWADTLSLFDSTTIVALASGR